MTFHTVGWSQSVDTGGALTAITALADQSIRASGNDVIVPALNKLWGAWAGGATISQAQFSSPTLRRQNLIDLAPISINAGVAAVPTFNSFLANPPDLTVDEALNALEAETAAGAEREHLFAWLGDDSHAIPGGDVFTIRATGATTLVAFAWTACALTFSQVLPAGEYSIVGMLVHGASPIAARLVFVGNQWRPGVLCNTTVGAYHDPIFRRGALGEFGRFRHNTPPQLEVYATAADTAQVVYLDLIKTA